MTHRHYCTYFDHRYLPLGLALYESLVRHGSDFTLWVLALDRECAAFLEAAALPGVRMVPLPELESFDPGLKAVEGTRSRVEYYFTCSPCLPHYLIRVHGVGEITYLDSDLWFFSSPEAVFEELGDGSVAIVPHRFTGASAASHAKHGHYNVGWLTFRADARGIACLDWWRARCIEWCFDHVEADRYADQKYLDRFPALFDGVVSITNPGANLAPWNVAASDVVLRDGRVVVDGRALVFFHFQGLRRIAPDVYDTNLTSYGARITPALRNGVFLPYIAALRRSEAFVAPRLAQAVGAAGLRRAGANPWRLRASRAWRTWRARKAGNLIDAPPA
jgi:hypothetical protein